VVFLARPRGSMPGTGCTSLSQPANLPWSDKEQVRFGMVLVSRIATVAGAGTSVVSWPLRLLYRLYERSLLREVRRDPAPRHVGIILDGNRRFGELHKLTAPHEIYSAGAEKLDEVLEWCCELAIPAVTLWVLSTDNGLRAPHEVSAILAAVESKLRSLLSSPLLHRRRIRVRAVGRLYKLPPSLLEAINAIETATADYAGLSLTFAIAYGGREEITDAVHALLRERLQHGETLEKAIDAISPEAIRRYIYIADLPDPDLIIRTSGEVRLSGFLLWQSAYSEFYFTDIYWPAFRKIDLLRAIRSFQQRERRFGL
jgi:short-chain Z-isoprenyl diphosphate synthase